MGRRSSKSSDLLQGEKRDLRWFWNKIRSEDFEKASGGFHCRNRRNSWVLQIAAQVDRYLSLPTLFIDGEAGKKFLGLSSSRGPEEALIDSLVISSKNQVIWQLKYV